MAASEAGDATAQLEKRRVHRIGAGVRAPELLGKARDLLLGQAEPAGHEQLIVGDPSLRRQQLPPLAVERHDRGAEDAEPVRSEGGVGTGDSLERGQAERVPERSRREDEERCLIDEDDLRVRDQAPDRERGADAAEGGAEDDEPPSARGVREVGNSRPGMGSKRTRPPRREGRGAEGAKLEESAPGQERAGAAPEPRAQRGVTSTALANCCPRESFTSTFSCPGSRGVK